MTYTIAVFTVKTPDDRQRKFPKHVEFCSKNKFEKLVHLVGFTLRIYHYARPPGRQINLLLYSINIRGACSPPYTPHFTPVTTEGAQVQI